MAWLCYGLLALAWIVDLLTPQLFIAAILFNGPIALSSLALQSRLTTNLVIAAEIANVVAGYINGVQAGHHWDSIAIGDRLLLAASFVLVGYLSVKTQEYAREAGVSAGRMRQVEIEKSLREATGRVRETLNVELVQRAITRESLVVRRRFKGDPHRARGALRAVARTLVRRRRRRYLSRTARAHRRDSVAGGTSGGRRGCLSSYEPGLLGRLTLGALGATEAIVTPIATSDSVEHVLIESVSEGKSFGGDALVTTRAFAEQASMALDQAHLFTQLGERNEEIARQKDELAERSDVIRDIVYALAHDLRTPLAAAHVTMNQALSGAYGELPEGYREILKTALAANDDQRRIVETLLLVARYEAGEASTVRERVNAADLVVRIVAELRPVAEIKGVELQADVPSNQLPALGDPHEIRRAIANLVANAIDATPRGGHVAVRDYASNQFVAIVVEDDGYGVPPELREGLFQRFGAGHPGAGTGLGLYIVRRIAEKHGGSVTYAPREPRGSTFTLMLPMASE